MKKGYSIDSCRIRSRAMTGRFFFKKPAELT
jgi:hypothetical protein